MFLGIEFSNGLYFLNQTLSTLYYKIFLCHPDFQDYFKINIFLSSNFFSLNMQIKSDK